MTTTKSEWLSVSRWWWLAAVIPLLLFAIFVWPTRYRYGQWHDGGNEQEVRTDRFTGAVEVLTVYGWVNFQKNESAGPLDLPAQS